MKITIDGNQVEISSDDENIVDVARREKIGIATLCYVSNEDKGCCQGCVVEVDGENKYACVTKPLDGMRIIVNRDDLNKIRKENINEYQKRSIDASKGCGCESSKGTNNCC